jgi:hypothetical protein
MLMTAKMTTEEFRGQMSRYGLNQVTQVCHVLFMKTGVVIDPRHIRLNMERKEQFSAPLSAAFRLLFKDLERQHEQA